MTGYNQLPALRSQMEPGAIWLPPIKLPPIHHVSRGVHSEPLPWSYPPTPEPSPVLHPAQATPHPFHQNPRSCTVPSPPTLQPSPGFDEDYATAEPSRKRHRSPNSERRCSPEEEAQKNNRKQGGSNKTRRLTPKEQAMKNQKEQGNRINQNEGLRCLEDSVLTLNPNIDHDFEVAPGRFGLRKLGSQNIHKFKGKKVDRPLTRKKSHVIGAAARSCEHSYELMCALSDWFCNSHLPTALSVEDAGKEVAKARARMGCWDFQRPHLFHRSKL